MWQVQAVSKLRLGVFQEDSYPLVEVWGVTAHNDAGRRFGYVGPVSTGTRADAMALVARIQRHQSIDPEWSPLVRPRYWNEVDPVYGSEEYVRQGTEEAWAAREVADDPWYYRDAEKLAHAS